MARPIDADAFISKFCHECKEVSEGKCLRDICGRCKIFEAVNGAPTISDKSCGKIDAQPVWIPCSEKLPEKDAQVLVYVAGYMGTAYFDAANGVFGLTELSTLYYRINGVTHWMPVPEPPQNDSV